MKFNRADFKWLLHALTTSHKYEKLFLAPHTLIMVLNIFIAKASVKYIGTKMQFKEKYNLKTEVYEDTLSNGGNVFFIDQLPHTALCFLENNLVRFSKTKFIMKVIYESLVEQHNLICEKKITKTYNETLSSVKQFIAVMGALGRFIAEHNVNVYLCSANEYNEYQYTSHGWIRFSFNSDPDRVQSRTKRSRIKGCWEYYHYNGIASYGRAVGTHYTNSIQTDSSGFAVALMDFIDDICIRTTPSIEVWDNLCKDKDVRNIVRRETSNVIDTERFVIKTVCKGITISTALPTFYGNETDPKVFQQ